MKKLLSLILVFSLLLSPLLAVIEYDYVPYEEEKFPIWSLELRRAESLFFGSLVLTYPLSYGILYLAEFMGAPITTNEGLKALESLGIAAFFSLAIALADYIVGKIKS